MGTNDYLEFGFGDGDEKIGGQKFDRFKGKEGESYRVSFAWWKPGTNGKPNLNDKTPRFAAAKRMYIPGAGYVLHKGPEYDAFGTPKLYIATVILVWPTDKRGNLDKARFANGEVEIKPWIFAKDKYEQLGRRHEEWHFGSYDLAIACTDTQFQKMDLSPCKENLYRKVLEKAAEGGNEKMNALAAAIQQQIDAVTANILDIIGRDLTIAQIREKLDGSTPTKPGQNRGNASGGSSGNNSTNANLDDLLLDV